MIPGKAPSSPSAPSAGPGGGRCRAEGFGDIPQRGGSGFGAEKGEKSHYFGGFKLVSLPRLGLFPSLGSQLGVLPSQISQAETKSPPAATDPPRAAIGGPKCCHLPPPPPPHPHGGGPALTSSFPPRSFLDGSGVDDSPATQFAEVSGASCPKNSPGFGVFCSSSSSSSRERGRGFRNRPGVKPEVLRARSEPRDGPK